MSLDALIDLAPRLPVLLLGIPYTLAITATAFLVGTTLGLLIAIIRLARVPLLDWLAIGWVEFFRTTPPLVHIVWVYYALPELIDVRLSDFAAVAGALAASKSAVMAEIFRGGILAVPQGQWQAAKVLGLGPWQTLRHVILPQTMRLILAPSTNSLVSLMKETSLAAFIALPELMHRGQSLAIETFRPVEVLTVVAFLYFVITYPVAMLAVALERRARAGHRSI